MFVTMLKGKIHRAAVVQAEVDYVGSITVDADLLDAAGICEYERVQVEIGDKVIIMAYAVLDEKELKNHKPKVVFVDDDNKIVRTTSYEKHGLLEDM